MCTALPPTSNSSHIHWVLTQEMSCNTTASLFTSSPVSTIYVKDRWNFSIYNKSSLWLPTKTLPLSSSWILTHLIFSQFATIPYKTSNRSCQHPQLNMHARIAVFPVLSITAFIYFFSSYLLSLCLWVSAHGRRNPCRQYKCARVGLRYLTTVLSDL